MARLPRLYFPGCAQHVIQRGNNREACFYDEARETKGVGVEWHLLSPLGMATSLNFRASRLACSSQ